MKKIDRPVRLIAYDTDINIKRRLGGQRPFYNIVRTRTVLYVVIMGVVAAAMAYALATRRAEAVSVIHDRNPLYVRLSDGSLRNAFAIRLLNKSRDSETFVLRVTGLPDADVDVVGSSAFSGANPLIEVGPDQSREVRVLVTARGRIAPGASIPLTFTITRAAGDAPAVSASDHFLAP
jgi:polyferredoxin